MPTSAFKEARLHSFDANATKRSFAPAARQREVPFNLVALCISTRSSLYEASLLPMIRRFVFPERDGDASGKPMTIRVLANPPEMASDSSLSHMFGVALRNSVTAKAATKTAKACSTPPP